MDSVHNTEILNQLEDTLRQFVKASLENIMKEELNQVLASQLVGRSRDSHVRQWHEYSRYCRLY